MELWEADAQDANSQELGGCNFNLREKVHVPQSARSTLGVGLEAAEPTSLHPGVEAPPESTGEELLDLEEVGAPWIWEGYRGALYLIRA